MDNSSVSYFPTPLSLSLSLAVSLSPSFLVQLRQIFEWKPNKKKRTRTVLPPRDQT